MPSFATQVVYAVKDGASLGDRKLRVAVIGGGPSGACAAETLAKGGVEAYLIERKLDNCKVSSTAETVDSRGPSTFWLLLGCGLR